MELFGDSDFDFEQTKPEFDGVAQLESRVEELKKILKERTITLDNLEVGTGTFIFVLGQKLA